MCDAASEIVEKLSEWSEDEVKQNIANILPTLISSLSSDDVGQKFQAVQALILRCLPCILIEEVEDQLLRHAVPAAKQLFCDAIECIQCSLEDIISTQGLPDKIGSFIDVCTTMLHCSATVLEYVVAQGYVQVSSIFSVPENVALMLLEAFKHCKESPNLYGEQFSTISDLITQFFRESHQLQVQFFNVLVENVQFKCFVEEELELLVKVLELISDGGEILFCLELKSMAEQWKGYTRLTQKYLSSLRSNLSLQKPFAMLVTEVERLIGEVIKAVPPTSDPKLTSKCLKVGSFLLKIILKLCEQFKGGDLKDSVSYLFTLVFTLYNHSSVSLSDKNLPASVIEDIQSYIVVAADSLLGVLLTEQSFRQELFIAAVKQPDFEAGNSENQRIPITFLIAIVKLLLHCDRTERFMWTFKDPSSNIFVVVFATIKCGHEDFAMNRSIEMVLEKGCNSRRIDLYSVLLCYMGAITVSAAAVEIGTIENVLLENTLQPNPWPALLAADLWLILARSAPAKMRLDQIFYLSDLLQQMIDAKINHPEKIHLSSLVHRLVPLLSNHEKGLLFEKFPIKTYRKLWIEIGMQNLPEKNKIASTRDLVSAIQESISEFLVNGQVTQMIDCLTLASAVLEVDTQAIPASSIVSVWNKIPADARALAPWLTTSEIRDSVSCWLQDFLCTLCEATSYLVTIMDNQQVLQVFLPLRAAVPCSASAVKLSVLKIFRSLAVKFFDQDGNQSKVCTEIAALFADLLQDTNPMVSYMALETFSYFAHLTKHEKIFVDTVGGNEKLKQMVTNYFQSTLPSTVHKSKEELKTFVHECETKEIPAGSPPTKKLKFDDEIDLSLDGSDFLGSNAFFEEELHIAVRKLTENCDDVVKYASRNPIPEETVQKLKTIVSELQKVVRNKK